ncbi:MAG: glycosyltransferase [Patescibacteria group bacterium]|nr:glycosyltransferase [Patescibacteria group bacterium]
MQNFPIVTISLINYNGKKFVFQAIESAVNQNYPNLEIILIDNDSTDGTREEIEKKIPEWEGRRKNITHRWLHSPDRAVEPKCELQKGSTALQDYGANKGSTALQDYGANKEYGANSIKYIKNKENAGFGRPHNEAMRIMKGDFILLLNYDAILKPNYIENVLKPFCDEKVGSVQGKLLRYNFDKNELYRKKENPELNVIDTVGFKMLKNRRIVCIEQGQLDTGQSEEEKEIFGADGAVPVYRKEALEDVKLPIIEIQNSKFNPPAGGQNSLYEYFDENFFMYKEDVDLAWRFRLAGWKAVYTPKAVAYHGRGSGDSMAKNYIDIIKERRKINNFAKYLSFKHQRLMQIKNDFPILLFTKHFPWFIIKEVGAWAYMAVFERFLFKVIKDFYHDIPIFLKKRKMVMAKKRISVKEMEKWFLN